jgi:hypothetical protein
MSPNTLFFISPGQIHYSDIASCIGYALFFTEEFLLSNHVSKSFLNRLTFYHAEGQEQAVHLENKQITHCFKLEHRLLIRTYLQASPEFIILLNS